MVSTPEAAGRVSVGAEESVCCSHFWIVEKHFMLDKVWTEFPYVCAKIWGFSAYFCHHICINLWPDAAQKNLHFPLRSNFQKKKRKYEHILGRGASHSRSAQCISACMCGAVLNVNIIYRCKSHPISPAVSSLHIIKHLILNWFRLHHP